MKTLLLATAAASLFAAPALAQDAAGSIGAAYVNTQADLGPFEAEGDGAILDGSVAMPAFGAWTVTLDGGAAFNDEDFGDDTALRGSAHLSTLVGGDMRVGGFVGAADAGDDTLWTVGAEAQKYLSGATLTGQVAYGQVDDVDVWTLGGDAAFYVMPNLKLNAGLAWNNISFDGEDTDAWTANAGAEYQFGETPFSVYGNYARISLDDADLDIDTWTIGLRYSFGGGLQARDRAGANLGRTIGGVSGALGFGGSIDDVEVQQ